MINTTSVVRILPMNAKDLDPYSEAQDLSHQEVQSKFFLDMLPILQEGHYNFRTSGLDAEPGTVVLFQYKSKIIASAVIIGAGPSNHPDKGYRGALYFDVNSIKVFDPVGSEKMKEIWQEEFKGFNQTKAKLSFKWFSVFEQQLNNIRTMPKTLDDWTRHFNESVNDSLKRSSIEREQRIKVAPKVPETVEVTATVFIRNPDVVAEVLHRADGVCERCHKPAPFDRKSDGTPYLEVHHKIWLADGGEDTVENAQALCPNCHREVHYGKTQME